MSPTCAATTAAPWICSPGIPTSEACATKDTAVAASTATRAPPAESFAACASPAGAATEPLGGATLGGDTTPTAGVASGAGDDPRPEAETWAQGAVAPGGCKDTWGRTRAGGGVLTRNGEKMHWFGSGGDPNDENGRAIGEAAGEAGGGISAPLACPGETAREGGREVGRDLLTAGRPGARSCAAIEGSAGD